MPRADISNRSLFARISVEAWIGWAVSVLLTVAGAAFIVRGYADDVVSNKEMIAKVAKQVSEQNDAIDKIKDDTASIEGKLNNLQTQLDQQNKNQNEKMDLMLKILQGDFDRRSNQ